MHIYIANSHAGGANILRGSYLETYCILTTESCAPVHSFSSFMLCCHPAPLAELALFLPQSTTSDRGIENSRMNKSAFTRLSTGSTIPAADFLQPEKFEPP